MKLLLDECVDWRLLRELPSHDVKTVKQLGWEHLKNGALLRLAATEFDGVITRGALLLVLPFVIL